MGVVPVFQTNIRRVVLGASLLAGAALAGAVAQPALPPFEQWQLMALSSEDLGGRFRVSTDIKIPNEEIYVRVLFPTENRDISMISTILSSRHTDLITSPSS